MIHLLEKQFRTGIVWALSVSGRRLGREALHSEAVSISFLIFSFARYGSGMFDQLILSVSPLENRTRCAQRLIVVISLIRESVCLLVLPEPVSFRELLTWRKADV